MWTCAVCSYENIPARTRCEICDGPRQTGSQPGVAKSQPSHAPKPGATTSQPVAPTSSEVRDDDVVYLTQLGFSLERARQALKQKGTRDHALEWLLNEDSTPNSGPDHSLPSQSKPPKAPEVVPKVERAEKSKVKDAARAKKSDRDSELEKQQVMARAKERERLLETERKRIAELRVSASTDVRERTSKPPPVSREDQQRQEAILSDLKKERELQKQVETAAMEAKRKRNEQEKQFLDISAALSFIEKNYDPVRYEFVCRTFSKIINKILADPKNPKFQSLNLASEALQVPIVRTVGALAILDHLGFKCSTEDRWILQTVDTDLLRNSLKFFTSLPSEQSDSISDLFEQIDEKKAPLETVYFVALELRDSFRNCINLPSNLEASSIDAETLTFRRRIRRIPKALQILQEYGFKKPERKGDVFWKCNPVDVPLLTAGVIRLNKLIQKLAPHTPISVGVHELLQHNDPKVVARFVLAVQECLKNILTHTQEMKYRRFKLGKFWRMIADKKGEIQGGAKFLTLFGFVVRPHGEIVTNDEGVEEIIDTNTGTGVAVMPETDYDSELIKLRMDDLARCWAEQKARLPAE